MAVSVDDNMYKDICLKIEILEARIKAIEAAEKEKNTRNVRKSSEDFFKKSWNEMREFYGKPTVQLNEKYFKTELAENDIKVERSVILFGIPYSKEKIEEKRKLEDEKKIIEIFNEIGFNIKNRQIWEIIETDRLILNSSKKLTVPLPIRVRLKCIDYIDLSSEIKKATKKLKKSIKFKDVLIGVDLNEIQIVQFMRFLSKRKEMNKQLDKDEILRLLKVSDELKSTMETTKTKEIEIEKSDDLPSSTRRFVRSRTKEYRASIDFDSKSLQLSLESLENRATISRYWSGSLKLPHEQPFNQFVDKLGPGQKVSRQVLGSPYLGEIRLILFEENNKLSITIIEARNLKDSKNLNIVPSIYVKLYLFNRNSCVEKHKTKKRQSSLNPSYSETLTFNLDYHGGILKIAIWGNYGKLDRKVFMGIAQINLDDLDLSNYVDGWYTLFATCTLWDLRSKHESNSTLDESMF